MSAQTPLTDPILNTPWDPPTRYWVLDPQTNQATDQLGEGRRLSSGRILAPKSRKAVVQSQLGDEGSVPFSTINELREIVKAWRSEGYPGATDRTRRLLEWWNSDQPDLRPFFCQREALETAVYLCEAGQIAHEHAWGGIFGRLEQTNHRWNDGIRRLAFKMATGSGKTVVMAMLMAWHAVNHDRPRDFLIIAPNLTVKDRLAELKSDHREWLLPRLTPIALQPSLNRLRVTILNFQAFQRRNLLFVNGEGDAAPAAVRRVLRKEPDPRWEETSEQMLRRLLPAHRAADPIIVINDEAHHCYRMNTAGLKRAAGEAKAEEDKAELWFSALTALQQQGRLREVFDLSATPMYLRRPADLQTEHFPWIVSDYPLSDAIEAGLTKIPRVPVDDDSSSEQPVYRHVYDHTKSKTLNPVKLQEPVSRLLQTLHRHYDEEVAPAYEQHGVIPVMIVVANNIPNATALHRWIAGYRDDDGRFHPGNLPALSNVEPDRSGYVARPPTLLVHSRIVEDSGDAAGPTGQIARIAAEQAALFAPEAANKKEQIQAIRDTFNSVGRTGEPGERVRCVISVGMLTEGWDAKTVTHIFGFRKFGSQLLCEQVTGRALRRTSFEPDPETGKPRPEYANVFGVPYEFMRGIDAPTAPIPPKEPYIVEPVPGREQLRIAFPNLAGYAWSAPETHCRLDPALVKQYAVHAPSDPTTTTLAGSVGETEQQYAADLTRQQVISRLAAAAVERFETDEPHRRALFASMIGAVEQWLRHPNVDWPERRLPWLLQSPHDEEAPAAIAAAIALSHGQPAIRPVFADQRDPMQQRMLDTAVRPFRTTQEPVYTDTARSELNKAPCHSMLEYQLANALDLHPNIEAWARNFRLGWQIPWRDQEREIWARYDPDFVARVQTRDDEPPLHLIIEAKGDIWNEAKAAEVEAKANTVRTQWIPAVESIEGIGRWRYLMITENSHIHAALSAAIMEADHA